MKLIGINGLKGSGKDYLGKLLAEQLRERGFVVQFRKFADPIKFQIEQIFGSMTEEQYDEFKRIQHPMSVGDSARLVFGRDIVRGVGMKMRSYDGGQQFLDYVSGREEGRAHPDFVIATDLRFENEFELDWFWTQQVIAASVESDGHSSEKVWPVSMFDDVFEHNFEGDTHAKAHANWAAVQITNKLAMEQINAKRD